MNKCLYCYEPIKGKVDFHEKCCMEFFGTRLPPQIPYFLNQMDSLAKSVVEKSVTVPGVQAKLSMSLLNNIHDGLDSRLTVVGALGGNYILKPPSNIYEEMPENEHVTMRIAEVFGIRVVPSSLICLKSGDLSFITRRVDRTNSGEKIHMLDMFQITEAFDKYKSSLEKIGKALGSYSDNTMLDKLLFFELTLFCFLTGNNDMHLKNFSMIESSSGWILSPAYDLLNVTLLNPEDQEELALTLNGKKKKLRKEHFLDLGKEMGLTDRQIEGVFKRFKRNKSKAITWIDNSFLSNEKKVGYKRIIEEKYRKIE